MEYLHDLEGGSVKGALEALLLVSSDAVPATEFAKILGIAPGEAASALAELAAEYSDANRGFQLREVAGGWRLFTHPAYHDVVESYVLSWDTRKLSQAALETLAVIAYHQPVSREGVKAVRGVNSDGVIASLREKGLVREVGRDRDHGQAALFGTTQAFLEEFGLKSLKQLPPLEDFAPDEESKKFIRERLSGRSISSTLEDVADDVDEERELIGDYDAGDAAEGGVEDGGADQAHDSSGTNAATSLDGFFSTMDDAARGGEDPEDASRAGGTSAKDASDPARTALDDGADSEGAAGQAEAPAGDDDAEGDA